MKRQGQASNSSGLGRIAPLPDSNPTRGRLLCNRKKTMGRNVNLGLTEPIKKQVGAFTYLLITIGGGAENRTPVHESPLIGISKLSRWFSLGRFARSDTLAAS